MKYLVLIFVILFISPAFGQRKSKEDVVSPAYTEGVVYALPRTGIRVKVQATKEIFQPGPYAAYAEQLLGIKNVKNKESVNWKIDKVKIDLFSEPDPEQVFKAMGDGAFLVSLAADGCLAGINSDIASTKGIKTETNQVGQTTENSTADYFQYFTDSPLYTAGDSSNNFRPVRLADEQKISKAAQRILECRRLQFEIAAGLVDELHPDGEAYKVSLKELKEIEQAYLSLFVGKYKTEKAAFGFDYIPKPGGKSEAIFRISEEGGIVPASDLSGKPVMIEFEIEKDLAQKQAGMIKSDNPAAGESGVFYRIPGKANIRIINEMNVIATTRATIAQFGAVAPIPEELLSADYKIEFDSETGAISNISKK